VQTILKGSGSMARLFIEEKSKQIIEKFESGVEYIFGCDVQYPYTVLLDPEETCFFYYNDTISNAFRIYLHTELDNLTKELFEYLDVGYSGNSDIFKSLCQNP
jgi:hypothetical protein